MGHRSARGLALRALREWREGNSFADAIVQRLLDQSALIGSDRSFATELFYGVLRNLTLLDFWIGLLRSTRLDHESRDVLRLGLYQLFILRTPGHAAVFEMVELAAKRSRPLINAVLRNAQRRSEDLESDAAAAPLATRASHPEFLIERWQRTFGEDEASVLCEWNNQPAPIYARVNLLRTTLEEFVAAHPGAEPLRDAPHFVQLASIPFDGLSRGHCYIQDPSTRTACALLDPQPGEAVLDACAAPGGKTGLLAEMMQNRGELIACDRNRARVQTLTENLQRLGVSIACPIRHDWDGGGFRAANLPKSFDRILVDAPCSNTGVMRRRIDVRWRLAADDFLRMQKEQLRIFAAVIPMLKPGGSLVYSTCSFEAEENEQVVAHTIKQFPFLKLEEEKSVLPFRDRFDGAYTARLVGAA